jgi:ABC-type xylose transport system permease subunit
MKETIMSNGEKKRLTEEEGSSFATAVAVGVGSVMGATALVAIAPVLLPMAGLGVLAALVTPVVGGAIGAVGGWWFGGKS